MTSDITGKYMGGGFASVPGGMTLPFRMTIASDSPSTRAAFASEEIVWRSAHMEFRARVMAHTLDFAVQQRALFATQVIGLARYFIEHSICCIGVVQAYDGRILGVVNYGYLGGDRLSINLQAIDPQHLPGSPNLYPLRGIGTALLAMVAEEAVRSKVTEIILHPLDSEAARFWEAKGFVTCGTGGLHCVRGTQAILALRTQCKALPLNTTGDEWLLCSPPVRN